MTFDYNETIWGEDTASLEPAHPTAFRLKTSLQAINALNPNARILEVGCGAGQFIRAIKKQRPDFDCYGFDISESAITWAQEHDKTVSYTSGVPSKWPYENNFFDAILIFDVLEHVESVEDTLKEIKRLLKNDGIFYSFIPCEGDVLSVWHYLRFWPRLDKLTYKYAGHINRYSRQRWLNIFDNFGFTCTKIIYGEHFFGQLIGVTSFYLMDRRSRNKKIVQLNNENYFKAVASETKFKLLFNWLRKSVNSLIYFESILFARFPSSNVHFFLRNK